MVSAFHGSDVASATISGIRYRTTSFPPHFATPPHTHDRGYFCLVLAGASAQQYGTRTRERLRGDTFFYPPGERQSERFGPAGGTLFAIELPGATAEGDSFALRARAAGLAARIVAEDDPLVIEDLTLLLAAETERQREPRAMPPWLATAREFLHAHYLERIALGDVARAAGVHSVHLSAQFHRRLGVTLGDYVRGLRVDFARAQLARTREPISDVALAAGFASQAHLTKHFRGQTGLTPARYRALFA